jgi:hypothetical protein
MNKTRFTESQIIVVLKEYVADENIPDISRKLTIRISEILLSSLISSREVGWANMLYCSFKIWIELMRTANTPDGI